MLVPQQFGTLSEQALGETAYLSISLRYITLAKVRDDSTAFWKERLFPRQFGTFECQRVFVSGHCATDRSSMPTSLPGMSSRRPML
jgi:hypothetical protein